MPAASVADGQHDVSSRFNIHMTRLILFVQVDRRGFDGDDSAARHGVRRIGGQVHENLFYLALVRHDREDV